MADWTTQNSGLKSKLYIDYNTSTDVETINIFTDQTNERKKVFINNDGTQVEVVIGGDILFATYDHYTRYRRGTFSKFATVSNNGRLNLYDGSSTTFTLNVDEDGYMSLPSEIYNGLIDMYLDNWNVYLLYENSSNEVRLIKYHINEDYNFNLDNNFNYDMTDIEFDDIRIYGGILYIRNREKLRYQFIDHELTWYEHSIFNFDDPVVDWIVTPESIGILTTGVTQCTSHIININSLSGVNLIDPDTLSVDNRESMDVQRILYRSNETIITGIPRGYIFNSATNTNVRLRLVKYDIYNPDGSHSGEVFSDNYITIALSAETDTTTPLEGLYDQFLFSTTPASSNIEFLTWWNSYSYIGQYNVDNDTLSNTYMIEISFTEDVELIIDEY